jgi:hypothetical protein
MKRVTLESPTGDKINVTPDQVDYLLSVGYKPEGESPVKSKVKAPKEVIEDGNI